MSFFRRLFSKPAPRAGETGSPTDAEYKAVAAEALALRKQGDLEGVAKCWERQIELRPEYAPLRHVLFHVRMEMKQPDQALEILEDFFSQHEKTLDYYVDRSWIATEQHEFDLAIETATHALNLDDRSAAALNNRGYTYYCLGRFEEAIRDLNRALGIDAGFDLARQNLTMALIAMERWDKALYEANRLASKGEDRSKGHLAVAGVYSEMNRPGHALQAFREALDCRPDTANAAFRHFACATQLGLEMEAIEALKHFKATESDPAFQAAATAYAAHESRDYELAERLYAGIPEGNVRKGVVLRNRAMLAARSADLPKAVALLAEALQHAPETWKYLTLKWQLLFEQGQIDALRRLLDGFLDICPAFPTAIRLRVLTAAVTDEHQLVGPLLKRLPTDDESRHRLSRYVVHYNLRNFDEALRVLNVDADFRCASSDSLYRAAVHARRVEWSEAERELDTALKIGIRGRIGDHHDGMLEQWQWLAGCHAHLAILPGADRSGELAKGMELYKLSVQAGYYAHRFAWFQPRLHPLREVPEFQQICGQS